MRIRLSNSVLVVTVVLFMGAVSFAQAPGVVWSHTYQPNSSASSLYELPDSGFVLGGYIVPDGESYHDMLIIRTNADGDTLWTSSFGQSDRSESASSLHPTADGGFILTGYRAEEEPYSYYSDVYLIKANAAGTMEWHSTFGQNMESESGVSVVPAVDGGYLIAAGYWDASTGYDTWLYKTDALGIIQWQNHLTWGDADRPRCISLTSDHGFALAGYTQSFDAEYDYDMFILKLNQAGSESWSKAYGAAHPWDETANHICQTSDGGYLLCGYRRNDVTPKDLYVLKTDQFGAVEWTSQLGGTYHDEAWSCIETVDGGYAVAASWYRNGNWQVGLIKYDGNGDTVWTAFHGDSDHGYTPYGLVQTADNGFAVGGLRSGGAMAAFLVKFAPEPGLDPYTFHCDGPAVGFNDATPAIDTITILIGEQALAGRHVVATRVTIDSLTHAALEELAITIEHDGIVATLVGEGDVAGADFAGIVFADASTTPLAAGIAPYTGTFRPHENLNVFNGMDPNGDWIITVSDGTAGNDGILGDWGISLVTDVPLDIDGPGDNVLPDGYALSQSFPNPFNPSTTIRYNVPRRSMVVVEVFNILGQKVVTLVNEVKPAGRYDVVWDAGNSRGEMVSAGVYFYRLQAGEYVESKKMVLLK